MTEALSTMVAVGLGAGLSAAVVLDVVVSLLWRAAFLVGKAA